MAGERTQDSEAVETVNKGNTKSFFSDLMWSLPWALLPASRIVYAFLH